jgi:hypothetical protein
MKEEHEMDGSYLDSQIGKALPHNSAALKIYYLRNAAVDHGFTIKKHSL